MASKAHLEANARYHSKMYVVRFRVLKSNEAIIKQIAASKGYKAVQPYLLDLIQRDSGIDLRVPQEPKKEGQD